MSANGADWDSLPEDYTADRVIGVSRGKLRPTVYFDDYSRFTQAHIHRDAIGFHLPPLEQILFVNMNYRNIRHHRLMLDQWPEGDPRRLEYARRLATTMGLRENIAGARLFELKLGVEDPTRLLPHVAASSFEHVDRAEARDLVARIRNRSTAKSLAGTGRAKIWYFEDG